MDNFIYIHKNISTYAFSVANGNILIDSNGNTYDSDSYDIQEILEDYIPCNELNIENIYNQFNDIFQNNPNLDYVGIRIGKLLTTTITSKYTKSNLCVITNIYTLEDHKTKEQLISRIILVNMAGETIEVPFTEYSNNIIQDNIELLYPKLGKIDFILFMIDKINFDGYTLTDFT